MVNDDKEIEGIPILGKEFKLSQFADDTVFLLRNFGSIRRMWEIITQIYEPATGMKVNVTKTEGLRLGKLKGAEYDSETQGRVRFSLHLRGGKVTSKLRPDKGWGIKWCKKGDYLISLGVPIGWDFDVRSFWRGKYFKCKSLMATWYDVERMSPTASAMVANAMVYSRFRYWAHCLALSKEVRDAVDRDVQALVWGKDVHFDPDELGHGKARAFIRKISQSNSKKAGGIGLLHWAAHEKALTSYTLFQYNNGREMAWKDVLDWWFDKFQEGRGAVFSTIPIHSMVASRREGAASKLPVFFRRALRHLRELPIVPVTPGAFVSQDEARAEPLWTSPRVHVSNRAHAHEWRFHLTLNRLQDLIDPWTGELYSQNKIKRYIEAAFRVEGGYVIGKRPADIMGFRQCTYTSINSLLNQWQSFGNDVGARTLEVISGDERATPLACTYGEAAVKIMKALGWSEGQGLGKRSQGRTEPHLPGGQITRSGLGATARAHTHQDERKEEGPKIKGFEIEPGVLVYGYEGEKDGKQVLQEVRCTSRGLITFTGRSIEIPMDPELNVPIELRPALLWDGGPVGLAETSFPHPRGWTFEGANSGQTLEGVTIRLLTSVFKAAQVKPPACEDAWAAALGVTKDDIPWKEIWGHFSNPILTPRDARNHFRVIHRSLLTHNICPKPPEDETSNDDPEACRLCRIEREHFSHIPQCYEVRKLFELFEGFAAEVLGTTVKVDTPLIMLGMINSRQILPPGLAVLHTMVWKFFIIEFVKVDTEGATYDPTKIWKAAVGRFQNKVEARLTYLNDRTRDSVDLGRVPPPPISGEGTEPLVTFELQEVVEGRGWQVGYQYHSAYLKLLLT